MTATSDRYRAAMTRRIADTFGLPHDDPEAAAAAEACWDLITTNTRTVTIRQGPDHRLAITTNDDPTTPAYSRPHEPITLWALDHIQGAANS